mgnify:CR=1 FL=1|jgi:glutaredoxin 3
MFRVYTRVSCPYCRMAKDLLDNAGVIYECLSLDAQPELLQEIKSKHNWRTVPMVFEIKDGSEKFIGGFTDLREYLQSGKQVLKG